MHNKLLEDFVLSPCCNLSYFRETLMLRSDKSVTAVSCPQEQNLLIKIISLWTTPRSARQIYKQYPRTHEANAQILAGIDFLIQKGFVVSVDGVREPFLRDWFMHL